MSKWSLVVGTLLCFGMVWSCLGGNEASKKHTVTTNEELADNGSHSHSTAKKPEDAAPYTPEVIELDSTRERIRVKGDTLYFFDSEGKLDRQLSVDKLNPLNKLTEGLRVHNYFDAEALYVPQPDMGESISKTPADAYLQTYLLTEEEEKGPYLLLCYYLTLANGHGAMLAHYSAFIGFDEFGEQRFIWQRDRNISVPVVDTTYTYLLYSLRPVETTLNAGVKFQPDGFELWNLKDSTLIYRNINNDFNMVVGQPVTFREYNAIGDGYSHPNEPTIISSSYVFFANEKGLYHWVYTKEMLNNDLEMFQKNRRYPTFEEIKQRPSTSKISLDYD